MVVQPNVPMVDQNRNGAQGMPNRPAGTEISERIVGTIRPMQTNQSS